MAKTKRDLDRLVAGGCAVEGCTHENHRTLYIHDLHCRRHISSPLWAFYRLGSGKVVLECAECGHKVLEIAVSRGGLSP